jgi:hypothetical protein
MSKKHKSKQTNTKIDIDELLINTTDDLEKLEKNTNIKDIIKTHKIVKDKLELITNNINSLKDTFESIPDNIYEKTDITDEIYDEYIKKIYDLSNIDLNELNIEKQLDIYSSLNDIINKTTNYLKTKSIEIHHI